MVGPVVRVAAVAGVLTVTAVLGGVTAVPVFAEPGDSDVSSQSTADPGTEPDSGDGGSSSAPEAPPEPLRGMWG